MNESCNKQKIMNGRSFTNDDLISDKEKQIVEFLRERNLKKTDERSKQVRPRCSFYSKCGKRIIDLIIVIPCVVVLSPVYLFAALGTFLSIGRPIFFKQIRTGKDGKEFNMLKFRGMTNDTDDKGNLLPASQRVTKFGKFIRKYSIDELPSMLNIIKGDMSIIGPRPFPTFFHDRMSERHKMRMSVRPGLECPRVINVEGEQYQRQFENDIWYVENVSFINDIRLFFLLFKMVFSSKDRGRNALAADYFVGYDDDCRAIYTGLAYEKYRDMLYKKPYDEIET